MLLLILAMPVIPDELSQETLAKLLKEQAVDAMTRGDTDALFDAMDEFRKLEKSGTAVPAGLYFAEADSARSSGDAVRAERAFNDYFRVATPEGDIYSEAQRIYAKFREGIPDSARPILDAMIPVTGGILRAGTAGRELHVAPFSISRSAVTRVQYESFVKSTGYQSQGVSAQAACASDVDAASSSSAPLPASGPVTCVSRLDADAYIEWLNKSSGLKFRLPSATEWDYIAGKGASPLSAPPAVSPPVDAPEATVAPSPTGLQDLHDGRLEWVSGCVPVQAAGARSDSPPVSQACNKYATIAADGRPSTAIIAGVHPLSSDTYRAGNLGFRVALGH